MIITTKDNSGRKENSKLSVLGYIYRARIILMFLTWSVALLTLFFKH
jgi:hypothetical protein